MVKAFNSYFDPQPDEGIINYDHFHENDKWREVHTRLLKSYIGWRLEATKEQVETIFRIHKMVTNKSIRLLCENIKLALSVGLSLQRIIKSAYVLHAYPKYTKEILRDYGNIAGGDLIKGILKCPKLFMVAPSKYKIILQILKEHEIPDEVIRNDLRVFQYSPKTIKSRLEDIDNMPELKILKKNSNFLKLIVHHSRAKSRLYFLQELQMKCLPLNVLSRDGSVQNYIRKGKDVNIHQDVIDFFEIILKRDRKYFEKTLTNHPCYLSVPFLKIEDTFNYLKSIKFENDSISKAPSILLYPKEKIKDALLKIRKLPAIGKIPISQSQRLNLALYTIEKEHHFTGNGIWFEEPKHQDQEHEF